MSKRMKKASSSKKTVLNKNPETKAKKSSKKKKVEQKIKRIGIGSKKKSKKVTSKNTVKLESSRRISKKRKLKRVESKKETNVNIGSTSSKEFFTATYEKIEREGKSKKNSGLKIDLLYTQTYQIAEYLEYYLEEKINIDIRTIRIHHLLKKLPTLPWKIARLLFLEYPGAIIIDRDSQDPIAVIEIFGRKPMGYNHSQFYARLVQSARCGIPFLIIYPSMAFQIRKSVGC